MLTTKEGATDFVALLLDGGAESSKTDNVMNELLIMYNI